MREMVLKRTLKDEIDKFLLLFKVALKIERANLGYIKLKIASLLGA